MFCYKNDYYALNIGGEAALNYEVNGSSVPFSWPQFELNGVLTDAPSDFCEVSREMLNDDIMQITGIGTLSCGAELKIELRVCDRSPAIRFRYILSSDKDLKMTKTEKERLTYLTYPISDDAQQTEVRFSGYDYLVHGYQLEEINAFEVETQLMGPILAEYRPNANVSVLTAYEHGSQYPDKFVVFERENNNIMLKALRGNYWNGLSIKKEPYETIWFQICAVKGTVDDLARAYREFQLKYCTLNPESRKPYIFYNTWGFQESNKFYDKSTYLATMNSEHIEKEIDIAHDMGVDVFVIDTGWFQKTGDWEVNLSEFPDGMKAIREKIESYGMKLGLWFNPTVAAVTSKLLKDYPNSLSKINGKDPHAWEIWETEASYPMCLVSEYWEAFADHLIKLVDTLGVTYFKWDAIGQYGCNRLDHFHGGEGATEEESHDCYGFLIGKYMSKVVDKVCKVHPEAIVDFDITEGCRYVGLGFLSSGKYFAMNNGPYYSCYNIPIPSDVWSNIFVHPGPARSWICRKVLCYDKWIPSVLMMTHYLPNEPARSQMINIASLILGQNGIWGNIFNVSKEGVALFDKILTVYKRVRDDITSAYPYVLGQPGATFEVHEKLYNGRGAVVLFANMPGTYEYCLQAVPNTDNITVFGNVKIEKGDKIKLNVTFDAADAAIVFFE